MKSLHHPIQSENIRYKELQKGSYAIMNYITRLIQLFRISTLPIEANKTLSLKKAISIILISIFFMSMFFITPVKADSIKESQTKKESKSSTDESERVVKKEPQTSESTTEQKS